MGSSHRVITYPHHLPFQRRSSGPLSRTLVKRQQRLPEAANTLVEAAVVPVDILLEAAVVPVDILVEVAVVPVDILEGVEEVPVDILVGAVVLVDILVGAVVLVDILAALDVFQVVDSEVGQVNKST
jgi:hypothetical protein